MTLSPAATSASIEDNRGVSHRTRAAREQFPTRQPNDGRAVRLTQATRGKVLVLCQDDGSFPDSVSPDLGIIRIAQTDIDDVVSLMTGLRKHEFETRRKLCVDQDLHRSAATRIGWSASAAAKARQARISSFSR